MTEGEWVTTKLPLYMLREYPKAWDERKVLLFWATCLRREWHLLPNERTRYLVALVERDLGEGHSVPPSEVEAVRQHFLVKRTPDSFTYHEDYWALGVFLHPPPGPLLALARDVVDQAADYAAWRSGIAPRSVEWWELRNSTEREMKVWQCQLIREIFGNPFRPISADPSWLTLDVLALARGISDEKAFDRMPILADALQDAGCDNVTVLDHCREPGEHVRGCWVVDMLLGN